MIIAFLISCAFNCHVICIHIEPWREHRLQMDREAQDRKEDWEGTREDPAQWSEGPKALIVLTLI